VTGAEAAEAAAVVEEAAVAAAEVEGAADKAEEAADEDGVLAPQTGNEEAADILF
jgi:hypothetical protein